MFKFLTLKGRMGQTPYLTRLLILIVFGCSLALLALNYSHMVGPLFGSLDPMLVSVIAILMVVVGFTILFYQITLGVRRLHDIGYSGWFVLIIFGVGYLDSTGGLTNLLCIALGLIPATKGENKYGPETA